jgi:hypothetical protein
MENQENSNNPNTGLPNQEFNRTNDNRKQQENIDVTPLDTTSLDSIPLRSDRSENITFSDTTFADSVPLRTTKPTDTTLPYEDPAVINPEELASFPKPAPKADAADVENESENRLVNKRSPVRDGTHITRTGNTPNEEGYI